MSEPAIPPVDDTEFTMTVYEEVFTEFLLDNDAMIDGRRRRHVTTLGRGLAALAGDIRPRLALGTRVYLDRSTVWLCPESREPAVERRPGSIMLRRSSFRVAVEGNASALWTLLRLLDGYRSVAEILDAVAIAGRTAVSGLLSGLAACGVIDVSDRPYRRFLHTVTKRGVLSDGGLGQEHVRRLATDGMYRRYPDAACVPLSEEIPDRLAFFHALTRKRRSYRDYNGAPIVRADFDAILRTACGCTGLLPWGDSDVKLRAHPSGGALYAIEVYPVVFNVPGLQPAVYHYDAIGDALEIVRPHIARVEFLDAAVPAERGMLSGTAAMICLSAAFERFELKYGEGGYRMLVAEAGHISQNLILAATALGVHARPWGGGFDALINRSLGLTSSDEQWVLSVIMGVADGRVPPVQFIPEGST